MPNNIQNNDVAQNYNIPRIQSFLAQRVDLHVFCFHLSYNMNNQYGYNNLAGQTPTDKSIALLAIASTNNNLGELVYQLVFYWLDTLHGNPSVINTEEIDHELAKYFQELQQTGNIQKAAFVQKLLERVGGTDLRPSDPEFLLRPPIQRFVHGYAVLVGIGEYNDEDNITPLPASANDVRCLAEILKNPQSCGYLEDHVHVLTGPAANSRSILTSLDWLAKKARQDPDATVIFYFSGHGYKDENVSSNYYLIPYDCDFQNFAKTTIGNKVFIQKTQAIKSNRVVIILDACHAGGMAMSKTISISEKGFSIAPSENIIQELASGSGKVIISSSKENELSYVRGNNSRSIFTDCMIEALSQNPHYQGQTTLGIMEMFTYLYNHVPAKVESEFFRDPRTGLLGQQHPVINTQNAENFPIALLSREANHMQAPNVRRNYAN